MTSKYDIIKKKWERELNKDTQREEELDELRLEEKENG